jgi:anthranilate synthase/aminodeoxychorismate synthase-like glutamine amidotransferase
MIVLIDNFDSFSYNLVQAMSSQGADIKVFRNNETTPEEIAAMNPRGVVISPGPCTPKEAGISVEVAKQLAGKVPILGVCLGHQSIAEAFGATVSNASRIMHGKVSMVTHDKSALYRGIKNPFPAGRYHSLAVVKGTLPDEFIVDATSEDDEIMGMHHAEMQIYGVQYHPESVLTPSGKRLLRNFLQITGELDAN